jgi:hypothetical protein
VDGDELLLNIYASTFVLPTSDQFIQVSDDACSAVFWVLSIIFIRTCHFSISNDGLIFIGIGHQLRPRRAREPLVSTAIPLSPQEAARILGRETPVFRHARRTRPSHTVGIF